MIPELTASLKDGNTYRFIDPEWSPGKTLYIHNHPEYTDPEWNAFEILVQDLSYEEEPVWRTLLQEEHDRLLKAHWQEILEHFRAETPLDRLPV